MRLVFGKQTDKTNEFLFKRNELLKSLNLFLNKRRIMREGARAPLQCQAWECPHKGGTIDGSRNGVAIQPLEEI